MEYIAFESLKVEVVEGFIKLSHQVGIEKFASKEMLEDLLELSYDYDDVNNDEVVVMEYYPIEFVDADPPYAYQLSRNNIKHLINLLS